MTTSKPHGSSDGPHGSASGPEDPRLHELLRAEAAAVLDDDLDEGTLVARRPSQTATSQAPSQVYSIRVPVDRLEQVRRLASERNVAPTTMLRQWVLTQLDAELGLEKPAQESAEPAGRKPTANTGKQRPGMDAERLEAIAVALIEATSNLSNALSSFSELLSTSRPALSRSVLGLPGSLGRSPIAAHHGAFVAHVVRHAGGDYLSAGLEELHSTIERTSTAPEISETDLYALYDAADEELPTV